MKRASEEELSKFKSESFRNAVRLFCDACLLYKYKSYPSSFNLAVAAYEELGKVHVIDRACDGMCLNPEPRDEIYDMYFKGGWLSDHVHKQGQIYFETNLFTISENDPKSRYIFEGGLEKARQQAIYVELEGVKVRTPSRITKGKAFALIQDVKQAIEASGDIGFSGFAAISNTKTEWQFKEQMALVRDAFETCSHEG
jgi:AbiV family abortive infection protein